MAKPVAPLLSFDAAGQLGKTMVYSKWKGRSYVRRYVTPANPNSADQQSTRNVFRASSDIWRDAPALLRAPWNLFAQGQVLTGRNAFQGSYVENLRGDADFADMVFSPGAKGGLAPTSIALTPGAGTMQVDFTNPTPPTGWTLVSAIAAAILDGDPGSPPETVITADEDDVSQASVTLSGLSAGLTFVGAWLEWTKADGSTAYGASLIDSDTVT